MSDGSIARYRDGDSTRSVTRRERKERAARRAAIRAEVEVAKELADGVYEVYEYSMLGMDGLDATRRQLAGDDPAKNMLLGRMQMRAMRKIERVVDGLFNE